MKHNQDSFLNKKKILIIDDETILGISCKRILEKENYEATYQDSAKQGLEDALTGDYDLILLDLLMPEIEGMEILKKIKTSGIQSDVIIITGFGTVQTAVEAMKLGASDFVNKPFTPDELTIIVKKVFQYSDLVKENISLKKELSIQQGFKGIICNSPKMKEILSVVQRIAPTDGTVCITGESGTGKEVIAQAIHRLSNRKDKPLLACDCNALAPTLLESELFGHVKGSFSGAISTKQGLFEVAHKGTLFLDEISNISMETQGKLLRVLETRKLRKVGDTKEYNIDIRLITTSNRDLHKMVNEGSFREDLFYRLQVIPIHLPPLRERSEDIIKLAIHFLNDVKTKNDIKANKFSPEFIKIMEQYKWPGNIRELKNIIERTALLCDSEIIEAKHFPAEMESPSNEFNTWKIPDTWEDFKKYKQEVQNDVTKEIEKHFIIETLKRAKGNISNAAKNVGMQRTNFHLLLKKYNLNGKNYK